jgi:uncharacterized protein (TIGR02147 family)
MPRPDVFAYDHYRPFVADMVGALRESDGGFSFRNFAKKAGLKSPNFIKLVVDGHRNLSGASVHAIAGGLGLSPAETRFFDALVRYNHARTERERAWRYAELCASRMSGGLHVLAPSQFAYYSRWYAVAIRELAALPGFVADPEVIGARLRPPVSAPEVEEALDTLLRLGLLVEHGDTLEPSEPDVATTPEVSGTLVMEFHRTMIRQALTALAELPPSQRHVSSVTLAVSRASFAKIAQRIELLWEEIVTLTAADTAAPDAEVFQLNVQLFPLTQSPEEMP